MPHGEILTISPLPQVPGLPGVSIIWDKLTGTNDNGFRNPFATQDWHTDLTHEKQPPGITHLHNDSKHPSKSSPTTLNTQR